MKPFFIFITIAVVLIILWNLDYQWLALRFRKRVARLDNGDCIVISWKGKYGVIREYAYIVPMIYDQIEIVSGRLIARKGEVTDIVVLDNNNHNDEEPEEVDEFEDQRWSSTF